MADLSYTTLASIPKPLRPPLAMPYGGHDLGIDREKLALIFDDMLQDLAEARSSTDLGGVMFKLDRVVFNLAVTLGITSMSDMKIMPGFPESDEVLFEGDGDGFDDLRWMAAMVQRGGLI